MSQTVISSLKLADLNSIVNVESDRQLTREETLKAFAIYAAVHPEARSRTNTEYNIKLPSKVIPSGNSFSRESFENLQAEEPREWRQPESSGQGCFARLISVGLVGLGTGAMVQTLMRWRIP